MHCILVQISVEDVLRRLVVNRDLKVYTRNDEGGDVVMTMCVTLIVSYCVIVVYVF